jgi:ABC-type antimicrobial peptide transport system permease subunit
VEIRALGAGISPRVRSSADSVGSLLAVPQALVTTLGSLGAVALFLAAIGLYGVTAYVAGRRARECAVRRVLGASRLSLVTLVAGASMRTVVVGLGLGVGASLGVGWVLKRALLGATFDPTALVVAPLTLAATALVAVVLPVVQATAVDPMVLLREE